MEVIAAVFAIIVTTAFVQATTVVDHLLATVVDDCLAVMVVIGCDRSGDHRRTEGQSDSNYCDA